MGYQLPNSTVCHSTKADAEDAFLSSSFPKFLDSNNNILSFTRVNDHLEFNHNTLDLQLQSCDREVYLLSFATFLVFFVFILILAVTAFIRVMQSLIRE